MITWLATPRITCVAGAVGLTRTTSERSGGDHKAERPTSRMPQCSCECGLVEKLARYLHFSAWNLIDSHLRRHLSSRHTESSPGVRRTRASRPPPLIHPGSKVQQTEQKRRYVRIRDWIQCRRERGERVPLPGERTRESSCLFQGEQDRIDPTRSSELEEPCLFHEALFYLLSSFPPASPLSLSLLHTRGANVYSRDV